MASLTKRATSKYWVACFTDRDGRRLKRSTATKDRKEAQKIADAFEEAARRKRTAAQARRVLTELHREITGSELAQVTARSFFESWLNRKAPETASSTQAFYRGAVSKFLGFLGDRADHDLADVTAEQIVSFRNEQAKQLAPKTVNHLVKVLRMVFRAAKRDAVIGDNPAEFIDTVRQKEKTQRRPFTLAELRSVLSVAGDEWKSMILFGVYTGQRLYDISSLTWGNIDLARSEVRMITQKTSKRLILPIATPLLAHLEKQTRPTDPSSPVHPHAHAIIKAQGKSGHLSNQFADLLVKAGLRKKQAHRKSHGQGRGRGSAQGGLSFHCLRHTAVTLLKEAGIPAAVVMELVGHDSKEMSEHYTHVGDAALRKAAESFPDITAK